MAWVGVGGAWRRRHVSWDLRIPKKLWKARGRGCPGVSNSKRGQRSGGQQADQR